MALPEKRLGKGQLTHVGKALLKRAFLYAIQLYSLLNKISRE